MANKQSAGKERIEIEGTINSYGLVSTTTIQRKTFSFRMLSGGFMNILKFWVNGYE